MKESLRLRHSSPDQEQGAFSPSEKPTSFSEPLQTGSICPICQRGMLDYDGCLVLRCPQCNVARGGGFT